MTAKIVDIAISAGKIKEHLGETVENYMKVNNLKSDEVKEKSISFLKMIGRENRVLSQEDETTLTLSAKAVDKLFEQNPNLKKGRNRFIGMCNWVSRVYSTNSCSFNS